MIKQLSSIDIYFLLKEIKGLEGSRVDKIYNLGKEEIYIQLYKTNIGKKILKIILGKSIFLSETKSSDEAPSHFCMMLRKHLENKILYSVKQIEPERILKLDFKTKDDIKKLYIEIFGKGNVVLCNNEDIILDSLIKHKFRYRSIIPKAKYQHPSMRYNLFDLNKNNLADMLKNSKKDKIVTALATELGLGGTYAEEVSLLGNVDKNKNPKKINDNEIKKILTSIKKIIDNKNNPKIIYKDKEAVDVVPFDLEFYKDYEKKKFSEFNESLDNYFTNELKLIKKRESPHEKQINELKRIIEEQKDTIINMKNKEEENRKKAELMYNKYQLINEILEEINKAKEKYSWEDIKKKLKGHKIIKDIDVKEKRVVVEID